MGCLVGLMYYLFHVKIISLREEKRIHPDFSDPDINEVDIYKFDPSDLPGLSESDSDEQKWYFFCEPYYKYAKSKRASRRTDGGYWKITGRGCDVKNKSGQVIGSKKNLVFYRLGVGGTCKEDKTDWVMHEFYVKDENNPRYKVESQTSSSHNLISDSGKNITENSFSEVEPQLLQTTNLVTDPGSLFPESTTLAVEPQLLFCGDFVPDQMYHIPEITCLMVDPQLLAESDATNSYDWLNDSPIPSPQLPINPDHYQGFNSSPCSPGLSDDCNVQDFQFDGELGDVISLWDLEN
ncbi:hypothetical protein Patl1_17926 [Pistacia atlantica]|uniref:Uncharacterized protein n=1 Tax=Pistacia atlantica TaxID=434234 RepID=A0ACC1C1Y2_9ROSI|nr:hypothetical protein Patl1_17926 [Pistacia atlantica]